MTRRPAGPGDTPTRLDLERPEWARGSSWRRTMPIRAPRRHRRLKRSLWLWVAVAGFVLIATDGALQIFLGLVLIGTGTALADGYR